MSTIQQSRQPAQDNFSMAAWRRQLRELRALAKDGRDSPNPDVSMTALAVLAHRLQQLQELTAPA